MGAGKTTIGKQMARHLGWQFVDMDLFIENRYRKEVPKIFAEKGEEFFREIERTILQEVAQFENTIISTGGGTPCFFDNMDRMNRTGITIYLKIPVSELTKRLFACKQERPLIKDKNREELTQFITDSLSKREVWYNRAAIIFPAHAGAKSGCPASGYPIHTIVEDLIKQINNKQ